MNLILLIQFLIVNKISPHRREGRCVKRRVFFYGDSISVHYGPALKRSLPGGCEIDRKGGVARVLDNVNKSL